jgi:D-tyrosyl-tRNA(Tyr) deacylase
MDTDAIPDAQFLSNKIAGFRIFNDADGKMNRSIIDVDGAALVVSQFTLCGDWRKGRRPSFIHAAPPTEGEKLYLDFVQRLKAEGIPVSTGVFGAMMDVQLINDGPVTFVLDSKVA